jgi:hypothetical protein
MSFRRAYLNHPGFYSRKQSSFIPISGKFRDNGINTLESTGVSCPNPLGSLTSYLH